MPGTVADSFAELACARDAKTAPKPANLSFEQAAAVPVSVSGMTALQAMRGKVKVTEHRVLGLGAGGGVGHFAVQLAKSSGAEVPGVCSPLRAGLVRSIGADRIIDHSRQDFTATAPDDVILDTAGIRPLSVLRRAVTPHGTLGDHWRRGGNRWTGGFERQLAAVAAGQPDATPMLAAETSGDLLTLKDLIETGSLTPALDRIYPQAEALMRSATPTPGKHAAKSSSRSEPVEARWAASASNWRISPGGRPGCA